MGLFYPAMAGAVPPPERISHDSASFGPYRLHARIAEGRRSSVFAGTLGDHGPHLAIRILRDDADPGLFDAQIRAGGGLRYGGTPPSILTIDGEPVWSDPLIVGENLASLTALASPFPLYVGVNVALGMLETLASVRQSPVHADLVPHHVMVGFDGDIHLRDPAGSAPIPIDQRRGYLAPEQIAGDTPTVGTDLFQIGILLFELTTNARLFPSISLARTQASIANDDLPRPRELIGASYPLELQQVILKLLRPIPADRYPRAADAAEAIRRVAQSLGAVGPNVIAEWIQRAIPERIDRWQQVLDGSARPDDGPRLPPSSVVPINAPTDLDHATQQTNLSDIRLHLPPDATQPAGRTVPRFDLERRHHLTFDSSPTERGPTLGAAYASTPPSEPPTRVLYALQAPLESAEPTSLDELQDIGLEPLAPIQPAVPPALMVRSEDRSDPITDPGDVSASASTPMHPEGGWNAPPSDAGFGPLESQLASTPAWGSDDMEAAFESASWNVPAVPAVRQARPAGSDNGEHVDTIDDDSASTALLSQDDLRVIHSALDFVPSTPQPLPAAAHRPPPPPSLPPLSISELPPLVPFRSKQADIATQIVRERVVPNPEPDVGGDNWDDQAVSTNVDLYPAGNLTAPDSTAEMFVPPANVDTKISVSDIREPSLVVPLADEAIVKKPRPVPWLYIAAGVSSAVLIAIVMTVGRWMLTSSAYQPAPVAPAWDEVPSLPKTPSLRDLSAPADPAPASTNTKVRLKVEPSHARVKVDGRQVPNETVLEVRRRPLRVEAFAPGYGRQTHIVNPGRTAAVLISLIKSPE